MVAAPLLGVVNHADAAVLSGGSYRSAWPRTNMQLVELARAARTADAASGSTYVVVHLAAAAAIRFLAVTGHNWGVTATIRLRGAGSEAGLTSAPSVDVLQAVWLGGNTPTNSRMHTPCALVILPAAQTYAWWRIDVADTGNAAGYLSWGYLQLWQAIELTPGIQPDVSLQPESGTIQAQTIGLVSKFDRRPSTQVYRAVIDHLMFADADSLHDAVLDRDLDLPMFIIPVPDDTNPARLLRRAWLCRARTMSALSQPWWDRERANLELVKIVA